MGEKFRVEYRPGLKHYVEPVALLLASIELRSRDALRAAIRAANLAVRKQQKQTRTARRLTLLINSLEARLSALAPACLPIVLPVPLRRILSAGGHTGWFANRP